MPWFYLLRVLCPECKKELHSKITKALQKELQKKEDSTDESIASALGNDCKRIDTR